MKIIVCGDSFNQPDRRFPGEHWSEHLQSTYGHDIINLSLAGASDRVILLQILEAVKLSPDLVVFNVSPHSDRVEFLKNSYKAQDINLPSVLEFFDFTSSGHGNHPLTRSPVNIIKALPLSCIEDSNLQKVYLKHWPTQVYEVVDKCCALFCIDLLVRKKINFLYMHDLTTHIPKVTEQEVIEYGADIHNIITSQNFKFFRIDLMSPSFHTEVKEQSRFAEYLHNRISAHESL